ncbi:hypothetical protein OKA06_01580 [Novosphingobium sp. MW5]|nr:hypothetical protein [Novosphingobium sp. MW5]
MAVSHIDSNRASKREWQTPEVAALKVDLRAVAQGNGASSDVHKASAAQAS